jgi:hypothetical protein
MVEITGTNRAGMEMLVGVDARLVGKGEAILPGGRAGAGVPAVVTAGTAKQGQCLGFMSSVYLGCSRRDPFHMGAFIDSGHVVRILGIISTSQDSVTKSTLATLKRLSLKLAGSVYLLVGSALFSYCLVL